MSSLRGLLESAERDQGAHRAQVELNACFDTTNQTETVSTQRAGEDFPVFPVGGFELCPAGSVHRETPWAGMGRV